MIELFAAFALGAASTGAAFFFADRLAKKERTQLLDRVMARDWETYKAYTRELPAAPLRQPDDEDDEARQASMGLL